MMVQCLRITFNLEKIPKNFLQQVVQKHAQELKLEGTVQLAAQTVKIIVCGKKDDVEAFIDVLHHQTMDQLEGFIEIEPFIRQKDYRGVFRIIE
jgi:acylphosphatase